MTRRFALLTVLGATALCGGGGTAGASVVRPERDASLHVTGLGPEPYGSAVSGVGDVNGDGRPDLAVMQERPFVAPSVLVVFGRPGRGTLDAGRDPGAAGFTIADPPDQVPFGDRGGLIEATFVAASVGPAGDVNGDGLGDVLVGHAGVGNSLRRGSGSAFVVFGKRDTAPVRLDRLGTGGFRVDGPRAFSALGFQHAPLGDLDGDGLGDVVLGADGAAFVVFGSRSPDTVDLRTPGRRAAAYFSPLNYPDSTNEHGVAAAGDANGDGRGDFVLGVGGHAEIGDGVREARTWVIFSKPGIAPTDLRRPGSWGYEITGTRMNGLDLGTAAPAGDVNRDGRGDVVLNNGTRSWVVPGRASTQPVDVRTAPDVLEIKGRRTQAYGDVRVAGVGDVNGDGRADVAIGDPTRSARAPTATAAGR